MRASKYNVKAAKQTVSITLNSDLYAQAKALDVNTSQVAEEALAYEVSRRRAEKLKAELREDIEALDSYESKHGSFVDMAREHYQSASDKRDAK